MRFHGFVILLVVVVLGKSLSVFSVEPGETGKELATNGANFAPISQMVGVMDTIAGTGEEGYTGDGGKATEAKLHSPFDLIIDHQGNLLFSDTDNHCIRRIDLKLGIIDTVVGCGKKGYFGDGGPAKKAKLNEPYGLAEDEHGNLYIVDRLNRAVRRVNKQGIIETIAGDGKKGKPKDGQLGKSQSLFEPNAIVLQENKNLFIADVSAQNIYRLDLKTLNIYKFAGTGLKKSEGDGGKYSMASFAGPRALAFINPDRLMVCEREGNQIREINLKTKMIRKIAGTGKSGYSGDGDNPLQAVFKGPKEMKVNSKGEIFIVDTENHVIRWIKQDYSQILTLCGNGKSGFSGDGLDANKSSLNRPHGIAIASDGTIYIGDTLNHRIRRVIFMAAKSKKE